MLGWGLLSLQGDLVPEAELRAAGCAGDERLGIAALVDLSGVAAWVGAPDEVGHVFNSVFNHLRKVSSDIALSIHFLSILNPARDGMALVLNKFGKQ